LLLLDRLGQRYGTLPSKILDNEILDFNIDYYSFLEGSKKDIELQKKAESKAKLKRR
jgi:hypothetical protein